MRLGREREEEEVRPVETAGGRVREQRKAEVVLLVEGLLPIHRIGADSHSLGSELGELGSQVAEVTAFPRSARCHRLRIEEQDNRPVREQPGQADRLALLIGRVEVRDDVSFVHRVLHSVSGV